MRPLYLLRSALSHSLSGNVGRASPLWEGRLSYSFTECSVGEASPVLISWWQRHKALLPPAALLPLPDAIAHEIETKNMCTGLGVQTSPGFSYRGTLCGWKNLCFCPPVPSGRIRASLRCYPVGTCMGLWLTKVFGEKQNNSLLKSRWPVVS